MKERVWANQKIAKEMEEKFYLKYPKFDREKLTKIAKTGSLEEFRLLCTALARRKISKNGYFAEVENGSITNEFIELCNERVKEIFDQKLYALFQTIKEEQNLSTWGIVEYKLFSYDFPEFNDEQAVLKSIVLLIDFIDKPLKLEKLVEITSLVKDEEIYYSVIEEKIKYKDFIFGATDEEFEKANMQMKKHIDYWCELMNLVFHKKYEKARKIIICKNGKK